MHFFTTVIGNVGSGKSTISSFLSQYLPARLVDADVFYKTNPFFQDAVANRTRWSLASDLWFLVKRAQAAQQVPAFLQKGPVVQDSGLLMTWVYANSRIASGHMTHNEMDLYNMLYEKLTHDLPKESLVIYLNLPIPLLRQRIKTRGREFEIKYHTPRYLRTLQSTLDMLMRRLKNQKTTILELSDVNMLKSSKSKQRILTMVGQTAHLI